MRSSPVDNSFRHAANQCCGGKFLLLRTRHALHELHGKRTNALQTVFLSVSNRRKTVEGVRSGDERKKVVMMAVMDACSRIVCTLELRAACYETGTEKWKR